MDFEEAMKIVDNGGFVYRPYPNSAFSHFLGYEEYIFLGRDGKIRKHYKNWGFPKPRVDKSRIYRPSLSDGQATDWRRLSRAELRYGMILPERIKARP